MRRPSAVTSVSNSDIMPPHSAHSALPAATWAASASRKAVQRDSAWACSSG